MKRILNRLNSLDRKKLTLLVGIIVVLLLVGLWVWLYPPGQDTPLVTEEHEEEHETGVVELSSEAVKQVGIQTIKVSASGAEGLITTTGEVRASENRLFHISPFVEGRVVQDNVLLGDVVRQGQTLALVQNQQIAQIQADYIHELHKNEIDIAQARSRFELAQKTLAREQQLFDEGISPRRDLEAAETEYEQARAAFEGEQEHQVHIKAEGRALMGAYGVSPNTAHNESLRNTSPVTAPRSGVIIEKNITSGDMVNPGTVMYTVADLSQVWLDVTVYPQDFNNIQPGNIVRFTTDSLPSKVFSGKIDYIPPKADEVTQTFVARAFLDNSNTLLKPGMFGTVNVQTPLAGQGVIVPEAAVQRNDREVFVFEVVRSGVYRKQDIILGPKLETGYLVKQGLEAGHHIVTKGSFALKSELLKGEFAEHGH